MPTIAQLYRTIGEQIGDEGNARFPAWKILRWINDAVRQVVDITNCLVSSLEITGLRHIEVLDYSSLGGSIITIDVEGVETDLTEGVDWDAETSNIVTATNITAVITALTGVTAYSSGANVYMTGIEGNSVDSLTCDALALYLAIDDDGYEEIDISEILTRIKVIKNIYNVVDQILYRPFTRQQYDLKIIDSLDTESSYFTINITNKILSIKRSAVNLTSTESIVIEYLQNPATLIATDSLPGILNDYQDIVINRVMRRYYELKRQDDPKTSVVLLREIDQEYIRMRRDIRHELRSHGESQVAALFYPWT